MLAAPVTVPDEEGAKRHPGQRDLTSLTIDYAGLPDTLFVSWNWDNIAWTGANTGDGCALFDTNDNLLVDAALCVIIGGDPVEFQTERLFLCNDTRVDRCAGPTDAAGTFDCDVEITNTDPFPTGTASPQDTTASCTIDPEAVVPGAELVNVCSYPSQQPNSSPSDCVLIIRDGQIQRGQVVVNDNGGLATCNEFSFTINPGAITETFDDSPDCSNLVAVVPGTYSITEPAVAGYATTYANNLNENLNCNDLAVPSFDADDGPVVCTITNNDIGASLTVTKVVTNDNGGDATCGAFSFSVNGGTATAFDAADCSNTLPVNAGTYTVTEPVVAAGYTPSFSNCTNVVIGLGGSATCTITNDDNAPSLTLVKVVDNGNGGEAVATDWTLTATGPTGFSGDGTASSDETFEAGSYDLSEDGPAGYDPSDWDCVGGTQVDADTVSVAIGEDATCTITNDDQAPSLTLVKVVDNDNGGEAVATDWTLTATGPTGFSGDGTASSDETFEAGSYDLSEDGPAGYDPSDWDCVGGTQVDADTVSVAIGEDATCTITNDDQAPSLTLVKVVDNDNGGEAVATDWTLTATGPTGFSGDGTASSDATFEAGSYDLSEDGPAGYDPSDWDCVGGTQVDADTVSVAIGEDATCTITNDDIPATLIVEKIVEGGDLACEDFSFSVNEGTPVAFEDDCSNELTVDAGDYTVVEEPEVDGYTTTYENCTDLSLANDETATCTITNTRDTGDLEIVKQLEPSGDPGSFDLLLDGNVEFAGASDGDTTGPITVETGTFEVSEEAADAEHPLSDYDSSISCIDLNTEDDDEVASGDGTALFVDVTKDSDIVCTITNTAIDVGIVKEHDEEDGLVEPGDIIEFTVTASVNVGNATNVVVTDTLPDGLTYVEGSASIEPDDDQRSDPDVEPRHAG